MSDPTLLLQLNIHGPDWSWAKFWHHKLEWLRLVKTLRLKIQHDSTVKSCGAPKFDPYRWSNCNLNRSHHNKLRSGVAVHRWWSSHLLWWLGCLAQTMCGGWSVWNPEGWKRMKKGYGDHIHSDIRIYLCFFGMLWSVPLTFALRRLRRSGFFRTCLALLLPKCRWQQVEILDASAPGTPSTCHASILTEIKWKVISCAARDVSRCARTNGEPCPNYLDLIFFQSTLLVMLETW